MCKKDSKIELHLFMGCPFTNVVWDREKHTLNFSGPWSGNTTPECFKNWRNQNTSYPTLPTFICWNIWLENNHAIFEDGRPSVQKVAILSISIMREHKPTLRTKHLRRNPKKPEVRCMTGWFDGAAYASGRNSGVGGVIWINENIIFN
jgi:hypothetical protein